jgi:V8-like Glu-specific endopeptidase
MSNNIEESLIEEQPIPVDIEGTKLILSQMENCICKIVKDNGGKGTGFFCSIPFPDKNNLLNVLITNNHILSQKDIEDNKIIKLTVYSVEEKKNIEKEIKMDESRKRYTYINDNEGIDFTIIEIKPNKDNIYNYLEIDDEILELECNRKSIYLLHYPKDKKLVSYGLINGIIEGKKINHYCNTEEGSSGSPILSLNNNKIIGVHYGGSKAIKIKVNYGTYIKYIISEFNNIYKDEIKNIRINDNNRAQMFY